MKILMLTPYLPFPLYSGGQIRTYNLLKNLSKKHQITLFSFIRSHQEKQWLKDLAPFCHKIKVFKRRRAWDLRNIFLAAFSRYPFLVAIYLSNSLKRAIAGELKTNHYDLIHAETFYVMPNLPVGVRLPVLLVEQTIEYQVYQHFVKNFKLFFLKPLLYFDVLKIKYWENYYWRQATRLAAMSDSDKHIMQQVGQRQAVDVVANGVDLDFFPTTRAGRSLKPTVLFVGNFKWLPNRDAAQFLVNEVWPKITAKLPEAKLWIVGRNPTPEIENLQQLPTIKITGNLADIRQAFIQGAVMLAPIRNGRGTKYKVLEAMASSTPVVTTPLGIEGIDARDGQSVLIAKNARELADKTIKLLTNQALAQKLARSARELIVNRYSWLVISNELDKIYQQLGGANGFIDHHR